MRSLFITGASGFVGRHLLHRLQPSDFRRIGCLDRGSLSGAAASGIGMVRGDLLEPATYREALADADTVLHMAAATGSAPPADHFRVNAEGTAMLVGLCQELGVGRFIHVSSIATQFRDVRDYPYAQSKQAGEQVVRASGLNYVIVRPTIVLGAGSPVGARLRAMAALKIIPLLGGGAARVQPVDVDDVATALLMLANTDECRNESFDLGGPASLSMEELLVRAHCLRYGRSPRVIRVPAAPLRAALRLLERSGLPLPMRAGQLASFVNDGRAQPNRCVRQLLPRMKTLDDMIRELAADG